MKLREVIAAVREHPRLRQALKTANAELEASRTECMRLQEKINELEPLIDEYYQESCGREYAAHQARMQNEALKKVFSLFCQTLDDTEKLRRFYDAIAPKFDADGFWLFRAAETVTGIKHLHDHFPYEDACGLFEEMDGQTLLKYLTAAHFGAVEWDIVPGTVYEAGTLLEVDKTTPEYQVFEKKLYTQALKDMGFQDCLPPDPALDQMKKETESDLNGRQHDKQGRLLDAAPGGERTIRTGYGCR